MNILTQIQNTKISNIQIDTSVFCGSKCWFCPVNYYARPTTEIMSLETFESILLQLQNSKLVNDDYSLWLSSYNEHLLYPYLKESLELLRKYKKSFSLLTNGINLLKNVDLINEYEDVIHGISVNLCAGNSFDYNLYTGNPSTTFTQIIEGLYSLFGKNTERYQRIVSISVNGIFDDEYGKAQTKFELEEGSTDRQVEQLKVLLPYRNISDARPLCDRAGLLKPYALDNTVDPIRTWWKLPVGATRASGCNGGGEHGGRPFEWLHISSNGNLYTCCQDYLQIYNYGNVKMDSINNLIVSEKRALEIERTLVNLCTKCWFSF